VGNSIELETIANRGHVVALPILGEGDRCCSGTERWARIHKTLGIAMGSAEGVVTEVDAIIEAHQKSVGVSGTLVSTGPVRRSERLNHNFPMIPHLFLTSARADA
jgi:hypothetical protein